MNNNNKLNCDSNNNFQCGGKCQPKEYRCPSMRASEISSQLNRFSEIVKPNASSDGERDNLRKLREISSIEISLDLQNELSDLDSFEDLEDKAFTIREFNENITEQESLGLAVWVSEEYMPINKAIYSSDEEFEKIKDTEEMRIGVAAGLYAAKALLKLPQYDQAEMEEAAENEGESLRIDGRLSRMLNIKPADIKDFIAPYEKASKESTAFEEKTFFATSALENPFDSDFNVEFLVKPKSQTKGGSSGRMVDKFKNQLFEGEVLYAPFTKFAVEKIERSSEEYLSKEQLDSAAESKAEKITLDSNEEKFIKKISDKAGTAAELGSLSKYLKTLRALIYRGSWSSLIDDELEILRQIGYTNLEEITPDLKEIESVIDKKDERDKKIRKILLKLTQENEERKKVKVYMEEL